MTLQGSEAAGSYSGICPRGANNFFFPGGGGAQYPLGPENLPLKSIYFTGRGGLPPPLNTPLAGLGCAVHCFYLKESEMYGNGKI